MPWKTIAPIVAREEMNKHFEKHDAKQKKHFSVRTRS